MAGTRDRMVQAATGLFRDRGYDGTGFRDVVGAAGTTPGVIYHHFPGGKTELGEAVVLAVGDRLAAQIEAVCAVAAPRTAVVGLLDAIERNLIDGELRPGCPIAAATMAADDEQGRLRAASDAFFTRVRAALTGCLRRAGVDARDAKSFASLAVAAAEGAVLMSRARRSDEPFTTTRTALLGYLDVLVPEA